MPRNVRNWWITGEVEGRTSRIEGGPIAKGGGFYLLIKQRHQGNIEVAARIEGYEHDGKLKLMIEAGDPNDKRWGVEGNMLTFDTER